MGDVDAFSVAYSLKIPWHMPKSLPFAVRPDVVLVATATTWLSRLFQPLLFYMEPIITLTSNRK
jgi:hypothetical protein